MGGRGGGARRRATEAPDWRDSDPPVARPLSDAARQFQAEFAMTTAVFELASEPGAWVRLSKVREVMRQRGYSRREQDAALVGLSPRADVRIVPIANLKSLSDDDRRAAVRMGGELKHAIAIHLVWRKKK